MGHELKVYSPYNEKIIDTIPLVSEKEVEQMLIMAHKLSQDPSHILPGPQRIEILEKTIQNIKSKYEVILKTAAAEGGKPYIDSKVEIDRGLNGIQLAIDALKDMRGREIPMNITPSSMNRIAYTMRQPVGVVAAISAFNHPFNLIVHQVIPAVAVGCPVIIKPATTTPLSCIHLVEALYAAGLPKGWCRVAICENDVAEKLVTDKRVSFFSFIGSSKVGWYLRSKLAPGVQCTLEHGGAAPVIIEPDADLEDTLPLLVKGGYYHAGQVCVSVQRVFAHESICKNIADQIAEMASKLKVGDPLDEKTEVGPLILKREVDRVHVWVQEALEKKAKLLTGGKKISNTCYDPTVLLNPSDRATISQKEVFGPVVCVYPYKDRLHAIKRANKVPFSFQAAIFTKNIDAALECVKRLNATAVMVNDHTAFRVDWMPFYGRMDSGMNIGGIPYSMHDMTYEKMMVIRSSVL